MAYKIRFIINEKNEKIGRAEGTCVLSVEWYETDWFNLNGLRAWKNGLLIQEALPELSANDREFLISGISPVKFDSIFDEEE